MSAARPFWRRPKPPTAPSPSDPTPQYFVCRKTVFPARLQQRKAAPYRTPHSSAPPFGKTFSCHTPNGTPENQKPGPPGPAGGSGFHPTTARKPSGIAGGLPIILAFSYSPVVPSVPLDVSPVPASPPVLPPAPVITSGAGYHSPVAGAIAGAAAVLAAGIPAVAGLIARYWHRQRREPQHPGLLTVVKTSQAAHQAYREGSC